VINAVLEAGLKLEYVHEFPYSSYQALPFLKQESKGKWYYPDKAAGLPLMFSIKATAG
jgi:hypothetical protein